MNDPKTLNRPASERPASERPASERPASERPASERPDPEQRERAEAFRGALQRVDPRALGFALTTGAFALTARRAYAQDMPTVTEVLNYALTLEYLERAFYNMGVSSGVIPSGDDAQAKYTEIRDNEQDHVSFLQGQLGGDAIDEPDFDFTGGGGSDEGPFDPFNDYNQFLILSQGFEDTGVRAYKGQAPNLLDAPDAVLTAALRIHSVEARHAAIVRRLVNAAGLAPDQEAWIEGNGDNRPMPGGFGDPLAPTYAGMNETVKYMIDVVANSDVEEGPVTESFDEALDMSDVLAIAGIFIDDSDG